MNTSSTTDYNKHKSHSLRLLHSVSTTEVHSRVYFIKMWKKSENMDDATRQERKTVTNVVVSRDELRRWNQMETGEAQRGKEERKVKGGGQEEELLPEDVVTRRISMKQRKFPAANQLPFYWTKRGENDFKHFSDIPDEGFQKLPVL